jgi:serine protease
MRSHRVNRRALTALAALGVLVPAFGLTPYATASAESSPPNPEPRAIDPRFSITIDGYEIASVSGYDGTPVTVGGLAGPDGRVGRFAVGEAIIATADGNVAARVADSLGGGVVAALDPAKDLPGLLPLHLVRFDPSAVDVGSVEEDLAALEPEAAHGGHHASSREALGTVAAAARLAREGVSVDLDWVTTPDDIRNFSTAEAPVNPGFASNDAFSNPSLTSIAVPDAWNELQRAGLLNAGTIPVAVVDSGYSAADPDRPVGGFAAAPGTNPIPCSGGFPCPFHGSDVASTLMAVPDNGFGAAGPAGPVATPILEDRASPLVFGDIAAHMDAVSRGARIINMSFSAQGPAIATAFMLNYNKLTAQTRAAGILQVASAGNDGIDVDDLTCLITCWESTWVFPCENDGVICVGALNNTFNSTTGAFTVDTAPAPGSNFGSGGLNPGNSVDIWASNASLAGPNTGLTANATHFFTGTSAATPLVAGAAAVIWSTAPVASANTIEPTLLNTSSTGSCLVLPLPAKSRCAGRIANALAGVVALIGDRPPDVSIAASGVTTVPRGTAVTFTATAIDPDGPTPTVRWFVDGALRAFGNTFSYQTFTDAFGSHVVDAIADSGPFSVVDRQGGVRVILTNTSPTVQVTAPANNTVLYRWLAVGCSPNVISPLCLNAVVHLQAMTADANNGPGLLPDADVTWYLDAGSSPIATGNDVYVWFDHWSYGLHTITVRGTDGQFTAQASITVDVQKPRPIAYP